MIKPTEFPSIWFLLLALSGCATLTENVDRTPSKAFTDTGDTAIGSAVAKETSEHPGQADMVYDLPEKIRHDFERPQLHPSLRLKPGMDALERKLIVFSPYFVPGKSGTKFLRAGRTGAAGSHYDQAPGLFGIMGILPIESQTLAAVRHSNQLD